MSEFSEAVQKMKSIVGSFDPVEFPAHYNSGKIEVIDFIEDQGLETNHYRATALKYLCRAGKKFPGDKLKEKEDIEKAIWYLRREIEHMEKKAEERSYVGIG
nr:MAG TPA: nucelotide kinase [Caudoviricetes sp.]